MPYFKTIKYFYYPYVPQGVWGAFVEALNFGLNQCQFRCVFKWDSDMIANTEGLHLWLQKLSSLKCFCVIDVPRLTDGILGGYEGRLFTQNKDTKYRWIPDTDRIKFPLYFKLIRWHEPYILHVKS